MNDNCREIAIVAFNKIRQTFPYLKCEIKFDNPHVEAMMDIPKQNGLDFHVNLNLQNEDELHLSACALWVEWFPCTNPDNVDAYIEAVTGLLSGKYRIIEYHSRGEAVQAKLQKPVGEEWYTIQRWGKLYLPSFKKKEIIIKQNGIMP